MKNNFKKLGLTIVLFLGIIASVMAQVTTSGMSGRISGGNEPLPGATVIAVHVPSGTQYGTVTNAEGRFSLQGMRTGGPYKVDISFVGYAKSTLTEINLSLGETYPLNANLKESAQEVAEIIVVGIKPSAFNDVKTGASTNINAKSMELIPSLNRSLSDYTKLSPFSTGSGSFVGRESYNTNVTVDGANFNNNFGLSGGSMPSVSGEPISMDAIEEMQVAVAPYDVTQSNFTGASVNAVTKSGTNTIKGSAYSFYRDQSFNGKKIKNTVLTISESSKKVFGFTAGGPIIKNKLFFFVSGEMENSLTPGNTLLAQDGIRPLTDLNVNQYVKASDLQKFSSLLKSKYGYETGAYENWGGDVEKNNKLLGKLDWNISNNHKLTVRYNYSEASTVSRPSSSGDNTPTIAGGRHARLGGMSFQNSQYFITNTLHSITGELNSRFNQLQNKLLIAYTQYHQPRQSDSGTFPFIDIMSGDATKGNVYMSAGYELFSWMNDVKNNTLILTDNATYMLDKHTITLGVSYENQYFANSYLRQGSGYYRFKDLASFERYSNGEGTGKAYNDNYHPTNFAYTYPINGFTNPVAELSFGQFSAYGQDEWNAKENLKVTAGLRIDLPMYLDGAIDNPGVKGLKFRDGETVDLSTWPDSKVLWSPRIGFNWDVKGDKSLKVRGGTGIFTGRIPFVWFTNQPTNSGMLQYQLSINQASGTAAKAQLARIPFEADASKLLTNSAISDIFPLKNVIGARFAAIDKNFKLPQVWRSSLGMDLKLPLNMQLTLEGIYTKDINGIYFDNINLAPAASLLKEGTLSRPYWTNTTTATKFINTTIPNNVVIMRNTKKGEGYTLSAQLDLPKMCGFSGMIGYSRSMGNEVAGKNGSDPFSAWQYRYIQSSSNEQELGNTLNNTPHRIVGTLNYSIEYAKYFATTISVFYSGYKGNAYSYYYNGDANKDGTSNDLMYIPANQSDVLWKTPADRDAYFAFAAQDPYLSKHAGEYAYRNAAYTPWNQRIDVRLLQDFKVKAGGVTNKIQFSVDVINFANLIDSGRGLNQYQITSSPLSVASIDAATNKPVLSMQQVAGKYLTKSFQDPSSVSGTYGIQLGLRYIFN